MQNLLDDSSRHRAINCFLAYTTGIRRKSMQEKESIMAVRSKLKILSLGLTVRHHLARLVMQTVTLVTGFSILTSQPLKIVVFFLSRST